jgi:Domain of unknown function (DUF6362)
MVDWTPATVDARLESAADVFSMLPEGKPQGYFNAWPEYFHSFADKVGQQPKMRRPRPSPRQITQAEETLLWLRWLDPDDALGTQHQQGNGQPPVAVRHRCDRLAAEWKAGARETVHGVRGGSGKFTVRRRHLLCPRTLSLLVPVILLDVLNQHRERT